MSPQQLLSWLLSSSKIRSPYLACNGHYNHMPDLGKCGMWWNVWDLARQPILDAKVLDRNVTWLTKHKETLDTSTRREGT